MDKLESRKGGIAWVIPVIGFIGMYIINRIVAGAQIASICGIIVAFLAAIVVEDRGFRIWVIVLSFLLLIGWFI